MDETSTLLRILRVRDSTIRMSGESPIFREFWLRFSEIGDLL